MGRPKQFKINPIESIALLVLTAVLSYSIYHLVYDFDGFEPMEITQSPLKKGDREPASVMSPRLAQIVLNCDDFEAISTGAEKIRLNGKPCNANQKIVRTKIFNQSNQKEATVFWNETSQKFSTDFIPLISSENQIQIQFYFENGESHTREVKILKES